MRRPAQPTLFAPPAVDERRLRDDQRTVLEAIDKLGGITADAAGRISYRVRGWRVPPLEWTPATGRRLLVRLRELGLVKQRRRDGLWVRRTA